MEGAPPYVFGVAVVERRRRIPRVSEITVADECEEGTRPEDVSFRFRLRRNGTTCPVLLWRLTAEQRKGQSVSRST